MMLGQKLNTHRIYKWLLKALFRLPRLIWGFAGRTYHIVGNLMSLLNYVPCPGHSDNIVQHFFSSPSGLRGVRHDQMVLGAHKHWYFWSHKNASMSAAIKEIGKIFPLFKNLQEVSSDIYFLQYFWQYIATESNKTLNDVKKTNK